MTLSLADAPPPHLSAGPEPFPFTSHLTRSTLTKDRKLCVAGHQTAKRDFSEVVFGHFSGFLCELLPLFLENFTNWKNDYKTFKV